MPVCRETGDRGSQRSKYLVLKPSAYKHPSSKYRAVESHRLGDDEVCREGTRAVFRASRQGRVERRFRPCLCKCALNSGCWRMVEKCESVAAEFLSPCPAGSTPDGYFTTPALAHSFLPLPSNDRCSLTERVADSVEAEEVGILKQCLEHIPKSLLVDGSHRVDGRRRGALAAAEAPAATDLEWVP